MSAPRLVQAERLGSPGRHDAIRPRAVARLLRPVRGRLRLAAALAAVGAVAGLLPYVAVAEIGGELLAAGPADPTRIWTWVAVGVAGAFGRVGLSTVAGLLGHYADADFQRHVQVRIARHIGMVPLGWFAGRGSGEVKKLLTDDAETMDQFASHTGHELAAAVAAPVAVVGYLLTVDWRMTLVTIAVIPVTMALMRTAYRAGSIDDLTRSQARINDATVEYIDGMPVVKVFGRQPGASSRFSDAVDDFTDTMAAWSAAASTVTFTTRMLMSPATVLLLVLSVGTALIATGSLSPADLLPFLLLGVGLPAPFMSLVRKTHQLRLARLAATHIETVLATPPLPEPAHPRLPSRFDVELVDVCFSYGGGEVLSGVSVRLEPGTVTALVGPSGSGKTTMARLVPRFFDVTGGRVLVGGIDVREISSRELLHRVAVVFQDIVLVRDTVAENIRLGRPAATDEQVRAAARAAYVDEVVRALPQGWDTVLGEDGGGLSGGERQRVTIARALLQDAPIVVLDEATAHVDADSEAVVQDALSRLVAGRTVLVIAHRLHTITHVDQIVVVEAGRVVDRGRHDDLLARDGLYTRMWQAQEAVRTPSERVAR